jgi:hypothetical protein
MNLGINKVVSVTSNRVVLEILTAARPIAEVRGIVLLKKWRRVAIPDWLPAYLAAPARRPSTTGEKAESSPGINRVNTA